MRNINDKEFASLSTAGRQPPTVGVSSSWQSLAWGELRTIIGRRSPLRVLVLSWEYPPHVVGGLGKHVVGLASALTGLGVDVHVVAPRLKEGEPFEVIDGGVAVHRVELVAWETGDVVTDAHEANSRIMAYAEHLVNGYGPFDLVHAHDWLMAPSAFHFKHKYRWPLLATIHATERGRGGGAVYGPLSGAIDHFEWQLCFEAWRVIVTSRYMAGQLMNFFQLPRGKIDIVPNGIDLSSYQRHDDKPLGAFRRRFADDGEAIVFFIGRLVHEKGVQTLVRAAPGILSEFPDVRFVVAGRGPMYVRLQALASELRVSDRFGFVGYISDEDRDRLYQVADVVVFPSLYEPFGIVVLEAMAAGVPVVVSNTGGLAEVVDMHETGLIHDPGSPESLAWAVCHTLRHPDQAEARAKNALKKVRMLFSWEYVAEKTVKVYERIVAERKRVDW